MTIGEAEPVIAAALARGDLAGTASATLRAYGPEIFRLLFALLRDRTLADEAYSLFCERLWTTLDRFANRCSMRTWVYLLARHAARDVRRAQRAHGGLSEIISRVAEEVRTETLPYLRTENRNAIAQLRDELPEEDQTLLILRVERQLAWNDLAVIFLDGQSDEAEVRREAARLRKRFQLVKERLQALGRERGLLRE